MNFCEIFPLLLLSDIFFDKLLHVPKFDLFDAIFFFCWLSPLDVTKQWVTFAVLIMSEFWINNRKMPIIH